MTDRFPNGCGGEKLIESLIAGGEPSSPSLMSSPTMPQGLFYDIQCLTLEGSTQWAIQDPIDPLASPFPKLKSSSGNRILVQDLSQGESSIPVLDGAGPCREVSFLTMSPQPSTIASDPQLLTSLTEWTDRSFPSFPQSSELNPPGSSSDTTQSQSSSSIPQLFLSEKSLFAGDGFIDNGGFNGGRGVRIGDGASCHHHDVHTMSYQNPPLPAMLHNPGLHPADVGDVNPNPVFQGGGPMSCSPSSHTAGDPDQRNLKPMRSGLDCILTSFFDFMEKQPILDTLQSQFKRKVSTPNVHRASFVRRKHPGKYKCPREGCGRDFTRKWNLDSHIRSHDGIAIFRCPICDRMFMSSLKRHMAKCRFPPGM